jgi:hypothetical protein
MLPSWSEEAAGRPLPWEAVCAAAAAAAATGVVRSAVADLGDNTTFAFPLCFLCVFWVLALMGDEDDAMGSFMVVLAFERAAYLVFDYPVSGPCMPWHDPLATHEKSIFT